MKPLVGEPKVDANLRPLNSIMVSERPQIGKTFDDKSDRGMVRRFQLTALDIGSDDIADNAITGAKIAVNAVSNTKISAFDWNKGTGGTISTATITASTATTILITSSTVNAGIFGTPAITGGTITNGRFNTGNIGTSLYTGGTVNPSVYQIGGTVGFTGDIGYLNVGTVAGTLSFSNGLLIGTS